MEIKPGFVHGWPGFWMSVADVRVGIVAEPGGRIASLSHNGEELLFLQPEFAGTTIEHHRDWRLLKEELGFRVWGGNKTWIAPQHDWVHDTPPVDLDAGAYHPRPHADSVTLTSRICRETGLVITRQIALTETGSVVIDHRVANHGTRPMRRGIWSVTQWRRPLSVFFRGDVRAYPEEGTSAAVMQRCISHRHGIVHANAHENIQYKVGGRAETGAVIGVRSRSERTLVVRHSFSTDPLAPFAHDSSVEVFNARAYPYVEIEIHGRLTTLPPGAESHLLEQIDVECLPGSVDGASLL